MTPQPGTAGTDDDPLDSIETKELVVNGAVIDTLVGLAFDSANQTDGVLRFDGTGSTNGITDGSAKVIVGGTVYDVAGGEWVDQSGTSHTLDSWEKVVDSQFDVSVTGVSPDPLTPGNTLDVTADITNNGTDGDTQTVTLDIDNSVGQVDSASVSLSAGGSSTQTLSWSVPSGQTEQDYQATVASADDSDSTTVTVQSAVQIVDDFDDGDLSEYIIGDVANDGSASASTAAAFSGSHGLRIENVSNGQDSPEVGSYPGDGLPNYPNNGETIQVWMRFSTTGETGTVFFDIRSESSIELVRAEMSENSSRNEIRVRHYDGSQFTVKAVANPGLTHGDWYRFGVDFVDGDVEVRVKDSNLNAVTTLNIAPTITNRSDYGIFATYFTGSGAGAVDIDEVRKL